MAVAEVPVNALLPMMAQGVDIEGLEVTLERGNGALLLGLPQSSAQASDRQRVLPLATHTGTAQSGTVQSGAGWDRPARLSQLPGLTLWELLGPQP